MTGEKYAESHMHKIVDLMAKAIGVPDSCTTEVICCDCGKKNIAAHCSWVIDKNTFESTGPHCGCRSV